MDKHRYHSKERRDRKPEHERAKEKERHGDKERERDAKKEEKDKDRRRHHRTESERRRHEESGEGDFKKKETERDRRERHRDRERHADGYKERKNERERRERLSEGKEDKGTAFVCFHLSCYSSFVDKRSRLSPQDTGKTTGGTERRRRGGGKREIIRMKSGGETEKWRPRDAGAVATRSGITAATGSGRNETDAERRGSGSGGTRKDVVTEAEAAQIKQRPRKAGDVRPKPRFCCPRRRRRPLTMGAGRWKTWETQESP